MSSCHFKYGNGLITERPHAIVAFTLVELMVSISVIAILIGVLAPAIAGAKRSAVRAQCLTTLHGLGALLTLYTSSRNGRLPDLADPKAHLPTWTTSAIDTRDRFSKTADAPLTICFSESETSICMRPVESICFWSHPFWAAAGEPTMGMHTYKMVGCPVVVRERRIQQQLREIDPAFYPATFAVALASYAYSPALFTDPAAWNGAGPVDVNQAQRPVHIDDIAHPSRKTALVEASAHHERSDEPLYNWTRGRVNDLAVDGHAQSLARSQAKDAIPIVNNPLNGRTYPFLWGGKATPLLTTKKGAKGVDW